MNSQIIPNIEIINLTPENIADYGVCGYKDVEKHIELRRKIEWYKKYHPIGLRIKVLLSKLGGYQGMIEYVPGKYAYRPVEAEGFMFIHCVFVGFKKEFKGRGYASLLIDECIKEAKDAKMNGVAVVTRKGPFMVNKDIFLKKNFVIVDSATPDFNLLVLKFNINAVDPKFKEMSTEKYSKGLTVIRSAQCPYSVKNVNAIMSTAKKLKINASLVEMERSEDAQMSPCAFGSFCIVYDGEVISHHPISNTRFENIMKKKLKTNK
jgi:hypothetical protein